ncbi:MAG: carbon-nitrogen hydrolase family protein [Gammaproteobacteria bacterium]|nr:carbon-nitrogen hydrolase [Gammaproteobacteria bacterium]MDP6094430.1 carbon-nitrogen hydrolase family protein [Gammaproteobacteria bacterium]HJO11412.1 carbon-nitrogen hydrolase family protein [Gammaproteobacteria bacterium]
MSSKAAVLQMISTASVDDNLEAAARLISEAAHAGAELVLLPENFAVLEGGPLVPFAEQEGDKQAPLQSFLAGQSRTHQLTVVGGTIPLISRPISGDGAGGELLNDGRVRPACLVFDQTGQLTARYDKMHLFDVKVDDKQAQYSESRSFEPGDELVTVATSVGKLGLSVCYDLRFPELYRKLFRAGAELVTVPSAFTKTTGQAHWETLLRARAIENQCFVLAANQGGVHSATRETWGHSMIIDPWGSILDSIADGEGIALAEIDLSVSRKVRANMPIIDHLKL